MGNQVSFSAEPELLTRLENAKAMREKINQISTSRSKYLVYLIKKALELEEKEFEEQSRRKNP